MFKHKKSTIRNNKDEAPSQVFFHEFGVKIYRQIMFGSKPKYLQLKN